jgi:hypothetical protein
MDVIWDGYRINYITAGEGEALVLIPGHMQPAQDWVDESARRPVRVANSAFVAPPHRGRFVLRRFWRPTSGHRVQSTRKERSDGEFGCPGRCL